MKEQAIYFSEKQLRVRRILLIVFVIIVMVIPPALIASKKIYAHDIKKSDKMETSLTSQIAFSD